MIKSKIEPIVKDVISGTKTARSYVDEALERIAQKNSAYNFTISECRERAIQRAQQIDAKIANGESVGSLAGVPFIAKDNFLTFGGYTTAASRILNSFEAPYQATVIELLEAQGAICVAKANLDAFAHGSSTENSAYGVTKNPTDPTRVAGGSSGGSATAIALDIVPFALGTDTGGSIRQPASFCGVVGIKPTYGRVSRYGVVAMASSTDTIGALAQSAYDVALVMDVIAGKDQRDATTLPERPKSFVPVASARPLKIGLLKEYMDDGVDAGVKARINDMVDRLKKLGHSVETVSIPTISLALPVYYIVVPAEIASNLARYDGIKYGYSSSNAEKLDDVYGLSRDEGFNDENKRRIMIGNYVLSSGYYDAYYRKAQTVRTKLINEFNAVFSKIDVILGPVAPTPAFKIGENTDDPLKMYIMDILSVAPSLAGLPALSVPAGNAEGLPVGAQLIGGQQSDDLLLQLANDIQGIGNE